MRTFLPLSLAFTLSCFVAQEQPLAVGSKDTDSVTGGGKPTDTGAGGTTGDPMDDERHGESGGTQDTGETEPVVQTLVLEELAAGYCAADGAIETEHAGYTGAGYANTENTIGSTITWSVDAASAGVAELTWRFASNSQRPATLWVNDIAVPTPLVFDDTGAWDAWATRSTNVDFKLGENRLTLRSDSPDGLPNVDHVEVIGAGITAGDCNSLLTGPGACGCATPAGEWGTVDETIVVAAGEVFDGGCQIYRANPNTLGSGDQSEFQSPVFRVENGATLKNVLIGAPAADGVHLYGDVTLENIHWLDVGEDAMTVKQEGTVSLDCGSATLAEDKIFQVNAATTIHISNFTAFDAATFMRQNGDTTFEVKAFIDRSDISDVETIFKTDSPSSHVTMTNSRYSNISKALFRSGDEESNGNSAFSTMINCEAY